MRTGNVKVEFLDRHYGPQSELVDDFVVQRNDGVASYNLATVLDDELQEVSEVVRGADLLPGTARHIWLRETLSLTPVDHAHVPLVLNTDGERLAKRDGAVTLADLSALGIDADQVRGRLAETLGLTEPDENPTMQELLERYDPTQLPLDDAIWSSPEHARE